MVRVLVACALGAFGAFGIAIAACGETRRPIGSECLRSSDCLSDICSARTCVAAPTLVTGTGGDPPDAAPRLAPGDPDASEEPGDGG